MKISGKLLLLFSLCLFLFLIVNFYRLSAELIKLRTGELIEGEIISRDEDSLTVKVKYGTVKIDKEQLLPPPAEEKEQVKTEVLPPVEKKEKKSSRPVLLTDMQNWLIGQIHPGTEILESFHPTGDPRLRKQGSTYDQALAGLAFLILNDPERARAILDFYQKCWSGDGFSNFYFIPTGTRGLEYTVHLGSNMWIALLALHYDRIYQADKYLDFTRSLVNWARSLKHYRGGVAMSNQDEWRAPWTRVVSTENNIDYYAVLTILLTRVKDLRLRRQLVEERAGVIDFLTRTVYDRRTGGIFRGFHNGIVDRQRALDTITWLVAAVGFEELQRWGIDPQRLIVFAEKRFLVEDNGIKGFDFTDKRGAAKAKRERMISIEWTCGMINTYCIYSNYYREKGEAYLAKARIYKNKAQFYLREMDKNQLRFGDKKDKLSYPYATRANWLVFSDSYCWKTPAAGPDGVPAGSVASTAWRIFAGRFNPLNAEGSLYPFFYSSPRPKPGAVYTHSSTAALNSVAKGSLYPFLYSSPEQRSEG